jgi:hypothetical protein
MNDVEITACFTEGHIKAESDSSNVGGIAGTAAGSTAGRGIKKSYAAGVIESVAGSSSAAGGIAGKFLDGTIENCYAWAAVSSSSTNEEYAGGIAGVNGGTIAKCYAAGTVQSKGTNPSTAVGGIAGNGSGSASISNCMALVSSLDGGPSGSTSSSVYKIGGASSVSGNYSRNDIVLYHAANANDPGINAKDGLGKPLADFKSQTLYTGASWNFTAGGDWKFLPGSGYDYPVLSWQEAKPGSVLEEAARGGAGIEIEWP